MPTLLSLLSRSSAAVVRWSAVPLISVFVVLAIIFVELGRGDLVASAARMLLVPLAVVALVAAAAASLGSRARPVTEPKPPRVWRQPKPPPRPAAARPRVRSACPGCCGSAHAPAELSNGGGVWLRACAGCFGTGSVWVDPPA